MAYTLRGQVPSGAMGAGFNNALTSGCVAIGGITAQTNDGLLALAPQNPHYRVKNRVGVPDEFGRRLMSSSIRHQPMYWTTSNLIAPQSPVVFAYTVPVHDAIYVPNAITYYPDPLPIIVLYPGTVVTNTFVANLGPIALPLALPALAYSKDAFRTMDPVIFASAWPAVQWDRYSPIVGIQPWDAIKHVTYYAALLHPTIGLTILPVFSIQASARNSMTFLATFPDKELSDSSAPRDSVSVQVPGTSDIISKAALYLADKDATTLFVTERVTYTDGKISDRSLLTAGLANTQLSRGTRRATLSLYGSHPSTHLSTLVRTIPSSRVQSYTITSDGSMSARVRYDIGEVRESRLEGRGQVYSPRDTVVIQGRAWVLTQVSINVGVQDRYFDLIAEV